MKKEELKKENNLLRKKYNEIILESQNLKKRLYKDLEKTKTHANFQIIKNILPVIDSLEIAYKNCSDKEVKEGIRLTLKMVKNLLLCNKVKTIKPKKNTKFNPKFQQSILKIKKHGKPNLIFNILQKGYLMCKKILRPALVSVTSK